ncbi:MULTISPECIES: hypothetical protein [unclassified Streptomyces]|uniref:hypothetical protein n=1 Tax=unclassified Streptomyces TaxID=2593676 RepID=UPI00036A4970|nr:MULTISPECIES: hypothetical protein [unclassified Streptomyces]MYY05056.1 hypothetical protein [Streptomyces sp. SID4913]
MAARRITTKPPKKPSTAEPVVCSPCDGSGMVAATVRVGRKRRPVGQQDGICLNCLGSGLAPTD